MEDDSKEEAITRIHAELLFDMAIPANGLFSEIYKSMSFRKHIRKAYEKGFNDSEANKIINQIEKEDQQ